MKPVCLTMILGDIWKTMDNLILKEIEIVRNRNRIRKYFRLFIRVPDGFESWKKWRSKISWHTHFHCSWSSAYIPVVEVYLRVFVDKNMFLYECTDTLCIRHHLVLTLHVQYVYTLITPSLSYFGSEVISSHFPSIWTFRRFFFTIFYIKNCFAHIWKIKTIVNKL